MKYIPKSTLLYYRMGGKGMYLLVGVGLMKAAENSLGKLFYAILMCIVNSTLLTHL